MPYIVKLADMPSHSVAIEYLSGSNDYYSFFKNTDAISYTPYLPVYNLFNEFIGLARVSRKGLVLTVTFACDVDLLWNNHFVLNNCKIYCDIPQGTIRSEIVLDNYTLDASSKSILAIPTCVLESNGTVVNVTLYNLRNQRVIERLDLIRGLSQPKDFEDALPYIENVRVQGDTVNIILSDGIFSLDEVMGTADERALWALSSPSVLETNNLNIDMPSADYRFVCPSFSLKSILISDQTGSAHLNVYNLPRYNTLSVCNDTALDRTVHLFDSCSGGITVFSAIYTAYTAPAFEIGKLALIADSSLTNVTINSVSECNLQLTTCDRLDLETINKLSLSFDKAKYIDLSGIAHLSDAKISNAGLVFLSSMDDISSSTISDITSGVYLKYSRLNNCKIDGVTTLNISSDTTFRTVEIRNVHYISMQSCSFKDTTLYMSDTSVIDISALNMHPCNAIDVVPSGSILNLCSIYNTIGSLGSSLIITLASGIAYKFHMNIITPNTSNLTLRYTIYVLPVHIRELLDDERLGILALVVFFNLFRLTVTAGTTIDLVLDVKCYTKEAAKSLHKLDESRSSGDIKFITRQISISSYSVFMEEFEADFASLSRVPSDAHLDIAKSVYAMLSDANVKSISVNIPDNLDEGVL